MILPFDAEYATSPSPMLAFLIRVKYKESNIPERVNDGFGKLGRGKSVLRMNFLDLSKGGKLRLIAITEGT